MPLSNSEQRRANTAKCGSYESQPPLVILHLLGPEPCICPKPEIFRYPVESATRIRSRQGTRTRIHRSHRKPALHIPRDGRFPLCSSSGKPDAFPQFHSRPGRTIRRHDHPPHISTANARLLGSPQGRPAGIGALDLPPQHPQSGTD